MLHEVPARFTKEQKDFLREKAEATGDSMAAILRKLVLKEMKND